MARLRPARAAGKTKTGEKIMTNDWAAALLAYQGRKALFDLAGEIGDYADAMRQYRLAPRDDEANKARSDAQALHTLRFEQPLVDAIGALIATPAPDLDAVAVKRSAISGFTHREELAGAFDAIVADIERIAGVSVPVGEMA